jgi:hypothetical protein
MPAGRSTDFFTVAGTACRCVRFRIPQNRDREGADAHGFRFLQNREGVPSGPGGCRFRSDWDAGEPHSHPLLRAIRAASNRLDACNLEMASER